MKTGLESLDTGASKITYSGNEGPKSPQETQQKMAEFELQEYMEEFERVFPDMKDKRGTPDYMKELQDYFEGLASKQDEGIGNLAMADPLLIEEYQKYVFEMEEQGLQPMSFEEFRQQAMSGMAEGGIAGSNAGSMLVAPTKDGSRPGYYGPDFGHTSDPGTGFGKEAYSGGPSNIDMGGGPGGSDEQFNRARRAVETRVAAAKEKEKDTEPKSPLDKIMEKTLIHKIGQSGIGPYLRHRENQFLKNIGQSTTMDPNVLYSDDEDKDLLTGNPTTYEAIQIAKKKDDEGTLSQKEFNLFTPGGKYGREILDFGPQGNDGPQPIVYPYTYPINTAVSPDVTPEDLGTEFTSQFTRNQLTDADKERISNIGGKSIFLADGGRANYAGGGITDLRQGYFLGKLVKKATRGIKKLFKSPIAKAALLGFGGYKAGLFDNPFTSEFAKKIGRKLFLEKGKEAFTMANVDPFKIGILGASALSGLYAKQQQDDEPSLDEYLGSASRGPGMDPRAIREYIAMNKGNISPIDYAFLNPNYYQTAADGGRIGLAEGLTPRQAALNQMYQINDDEEDKKLLSKGGSAGLPPITAGVEGQNLQSFSDDETPTPTQQDQMPRPMPNPMMMAGRMNPMMMAGRMNPMMMRGMNPMMMRGMNPMMARGMMPRMMAQEGGRIGYATGRNEYLKRLEHLMFLGYNYDSAKEIAQDDDKYQIESTRGLGNAQGGRIGAQEGGLMDLGGMEKDYRNEGGFVPIGGQERADDVPARLSKNEFVFTADAVRNAGDGDIDKGAEIMENMMENLEKGGKVSEESQGLEGARDMFATAQRLEGVL